MATVAVTPAQLNSMDLHPGNPGLEKLTNSDYVRRKLLEDGLKATNQSGRIAIIGDDIFATKAASIGASARCNFKLDVVQCTASLPGAGHEGGALVIAPDTYMYFEEATLWSSNNLTHSKGQDKHTQHLQIASILSPHTSIMSQTLLWLVTNTWTYILPNTKLLTMH